MKQVLHSLRSSVAASVSSSPAMTTASAADPIVVYELKLEQDGSPGKEKKYIRLPPPVKPYILRFSLEIGSLASRQGVLYTNCPQGKEEFQRSKYWQHE